MRDAQFLRRSELYQEKHTVWSSFLSLSKRSGEVWLSFCPQNIIAAIVMSLLPYSEWYWPRKTKLHLCATDDFTVKLNLRTWCKVDARWDELMWDNQFEITFEIISSYIVNIRLVLPCNSVAQYNHFSCLFILVYMVFIVLNRRNCHRTELNSFTVIYGKSLILKIVIVLRI